MAQPAVDPQQWYNSSDVPETPIRPPWLDWQEIKIGAFLEVNAQGRVGRCSVVIPSGDHRIDENFCRALIKRARFKPGSIGVYLNVVVIPVRQALF